MNGHFVTTYHSNTLFLDQSEPWEPSGYTEVADEATFENGLFIKRFDRSGRWFSKKPNPHYEKILQMSVAEILREQNVQFMNWHMPTIKFV